MAKRSTSRRTIRAGKISVPKLVKEFRESGTAALLAMPDRERDGLLQAANQQYYCAQKPLLTDEEYDVLREFVLELQPNNPLATDPHATCMVPAKGKVKLPFEMWSMDKIKPDSGILERWKARFAAPYVLSCKLDGVSGLYANGKLYTRGDGKMGQDVSHLIPYLQLPTSTDLAIRGEFIVPKTALPGEVRRAVLQPSKLRCRRCELKDARARQVPRLALRCI